MVRSAISQRQNNKQRDVLSSDVFRKEKIYIYTLGNPDVSSNELYLTNKAILKILSNKQPEVNFVISRKAVVEGVWSDTARYGINKAFGARLSGQVTIPDFYGEQSNGLRIDETYLYTNAPIEEYVNDDGFIQEVPNIPWWIPQGRVQETSRGNVIIDIQTMNSYDWQTTSSEGEIINKEINLSLTAKRGISVEGFKIETDAHALWSAVDGIYMVDDDGVRVDCDIDWGRTISENMDIIHADAKMVDNDGSTLKIEPYILGILKFYNWIKYKAAQADLGTPYNALSYSTAAFDTIPRDNSIIPIPIGNSANEIYLNDRDTPKQLQTEFIENLNYINLINNVRITGYYGIVGTVLKIRNRSLSESIRDGSETIRTILPNSSLSEVPPYITTTYSNGAIVKQSNEPSPVYDNANKDIPFWWQTDCKNNIVATRGTPVISPWYSDALLKQVYGLPKEIRTQSSDDKIWTENQMNNLITGKSNVYKGFQIEKIPSILKSVSKPDRYADLDIGNADHRKYFFISTFNMKNYYETNKDLFESITPDTTLTVRQYELDKFGDTFQFLNPISMQSLFINFLFKQRGGLDIPIWVKFKKAIKFPKTYEFNFVDGGKYFKLTQYKDYNNKLLALDDKGEEIPPFHQQTMWYKTKNPAATRNSGTFIDSAVLKKSSGKKSTKWLKK